MRKNDQSTTISELKEVIDDFCTQRDWGQYHTAKDLAIGAVTEASELLEHFRFLTDQQCLEALNDQEKREAISDELSDVLFFLLRFSQKYDLDLTKSFYNKMTKNNLKYPVERFKGRNEKSNIVID